MTHIRVRPHSTIGQKAKWEKFKHMQPSPGQYLFYSKIFTRGPNEELCWGSGVYGPKTFKENNTAYKAIRWEMKEHKKRLIREYKKRLGRRLTNKELSAIHALQKMCNTG